MKTRYLANGLAVAAMAHSRSIVRQMIARWLPLMMSLFAVPALAQQNVRVPVEQGGHTLQLAAQLYHPKGAGRFPAVAMFHGCGGPGQNNARMAGLLASWGYAVLTVDSFSARKLTDVCGRHWPTQADAEARARDIDAAIHWLQTQKSVDPARIAFMGYSYGGGTAMLRAFTPHLDDTTPPARAAILVYPDCGLADAMGPKLRTRQPTMIAMAALDDWTPVAQCQGVLNRIVQGRDLIETHVYEGAYHSFDALGLPVRYLADVGNRSKPGGCCGAHYGANEAAWKAFVADVRSFLDRQMGPPKPAARTP
jgi:dienelactone hydrolase